MTQVPLITVHFFRQKELKLLFTALQEYCGDCMSD